MKSKLQRIFNKAVTLTLAFSLALPAAPLSYALQQQQDHGEGDPRDVPSPRPTQPGSGNSNNTGDTTTTTSQSNNNDEANADACKNECAEYNRSLLPNGGGAMRLSYAQEYCGVPEGDSSTLSGAGTGSTIVGGSGTSGTTSSSGANERGIDPNYKTGDERWDNCFQTLTLRWREVGPHCLALEQSQKGAKAETYAIVYYGIAAAACAAACASSIGGPVSAGAAIGCSVGGAAAYAADRIGEKVILDDVRWGDVNYYGAGGSVAGGVSAAFSGGRNMGGTLLACASAGLMSFAFMSRIGARSGMKHAADEACRTVKTFLSANPMPEYRNDETIVTKTPDPQSRVLPPGSGGNGISGKGGGLGSGSSLSLAELTSAVRGFPNSPQFAQATAGDTFAPLFKAIDGKEKAPEALQQAAGLDINDLARRLNSGQSMSQIASSTPALAGLAGPFKQVEKNAAKFLAPKQMLGSIGTMRSGGGAAKPAAKTNPFAMFGGMRAPVEGGGAPTETTFEKAKRELAASEAAGDIWHEGFGGTIFQIVSGKLDKTRERVDQLEWETPLNRALLGLPARKPASAAKKGLR